MKKSQQTTQTRLTQKQKLEGVALQGFTRNDKAMREK